MLSKKMDDHIYDYYIFSIAHGLRYRNDQKLEEYGITNRQARLLGFLYRAEKNGAEITNKKLQVLMNLRGSSVTSLINGLEKSSFILRSAKEEDRRGTEYQLTSKSIGLIEEMEKVFNQTERELLQGMSQKEKEQFLKLLEKAYQNLSS